MTEVDVQDTAANLAHDELLDATQSTLGELLKNDSLLQDLPNDITVEEIQSQIAVEHGQSITIYINRETEPTLTIIVPQNATVRGLKKAIANHFATFQRRKRLNTKISWKYIWKTYNLYYDSVILDNDNANIQEYGVVNKVTLRFKKKDKRKKN